VLIICVCVCVFVCVCVCVCYRSSRCSESFKAKVRYQQKALNLGNKMNVVIYQKILDLKVMTDIVPISL